MQTLMQDVAAAAGVSTTTVSHVLNGTRTVATETRERVLRAVAELGYVQNASARSLVQGTSRAFGLIISNIENPFFTPLIKGFDEACHEAGLELVLSMTNYAQAHAEAAVRRMVQDRVRGVAVMSSQFDPALVEQMRARGLPVVMLDDPSVGPHKSSICIDYSAGVSHALKRLSALGHREIAIVHGPPALVSAERFRLLLIRTIEEYGLELVGSVEGNYRPDGGQAAAQELLSRRNKPTAILCANDLMAIGAMSEAMELGRRVPEDLSIVGADDIAFAQYSRPSLATVHIPLREIGRAAFTVLREMAEDPKRTGTETVLHTHFVARNSIGPAPGRLGRPPVRTEKGGEA